MNKQMFASRGTILTKKGFTLIELLAVIVILAIIALIATPIVLNIIDDSKKSSIMRSAENYLTAVEYSVAQAVIKGKKIEDKTYPIMSSGNICLGTLSGDTCDNELVVEVKGEPPQRGTITFTGRKLATYSFLYTGGMTVTDGKVNSNYVCKLISGTAKTEGAKYQCKVKDNMPEGYEDGYYFYVLSNNEDGTSNLIMERNICDDGNVDTAAKDCQMFWAGKVAKYETDSGPITAMNYLHKATSDWENIPNVVLNYVDEGNIASAGVYGYGGIKTVGKKTEITKKDLITVTASYENLKARMMYFNEIEDGYIFTGTYLYDFLTSCSDCYVTEKPNIVEGINGYWGLSSHSGTNIQAHRVSWEGFHSTNATIKKRKFGVRPVITLNLDVFSYNG